MKMLAWSTAQALALATDAYWQLSSKSSLRMVKINLLSRKSMIGNVTISSMTTKCNNL